MVVGLLALASRIGKRIQLKIECLLVRTRLELVLLRAPVPIYFIIHKQLLLVLGAVRNNVVLRALKLAWIVRLLVNQALERGGDCGFCLENFTLEQFGTQLHLMRI